MARGLGGESLAGTSQRIATGRVTQAPATSGYIYVSTGLATPTRIFTQFTTLTTTSWIFRLTSFTGSQATILMVAVGTFTAGTVVTSSDSATASFDFLAYDDSA